MQLQIDFQPGITEQFATFNECLSAAVYGAEKGLTRCALRCGVSVPMFTKMLAGTERRNVPAKFVPLIIEETSDMRPIHWLIEKFLHDPSEQGVALAHELRQFLTKGSRLLDKIAAQEQQPRAVRGVGK